MKIRIKEVTYKYADGSQKTWYIPQYRRWFLWWKIPTNKATPYPSVADIGDVVIEESSERAKEKLAYFLNHTIVK